MATAELAILIYKVVTDCMIFYFFKDDPYVK